MKYANTLIVDGREVVVTVLPLSMVPGFDPDNPPQDDTYSVEDEVEVGWIKSADGKFYAPPPTPVPVPKSCTSLEFMDRFTEPELLGIVSATMTVALVKLWYDRLIAATDVVYADPRVLAGLQALVSAGLLDAHRIDEILPPAWRGEATS